MLRLVKDTAPPSVISSWTRVILDALTELEIDPTEVLADAGFAPDALADPNARLPARATAQLWRRAALRSGDPAFGLFASRFVRPTTFHALGFAVSASATLREALTRLLRYSHLVSDAGELSFSEQGGVGRLAIVTHSVDAPSFEARDAILSLIVRTCRLLTDSEFTLLSVEHRRAMPPEPAAYERFYRCPVSFDGSADALTFSSATLDRPLSSGNPELARHNDDLVRKYLAEIREGTVVDRVRRALVEHLSGDPSPEKVASALAMSSRSLQRRLKEHGTSYAEVLRETRRELALSYLRDASCSITEITFLLGFEDASAFARAFRSWTGLSPSEFRSKL
ncbi:MAG: AraC family transcriptional regulator [Myxococcaceae bacterium]|nr:AraC family transcriptional regulator [Myxococcaceae bacterium]